MVRERGRGQGTSPQPSSHLPPVQIWRPLTLFISGSNETAGYAGSANPTLRRSQERDVIVALSNEQRKTEGHLETFFRKV